MSHLVAGQEFGPLEDIYRQKVAKNLVTLRGHYLPGGCLYLGRMRDEFPGTDGLDRVSSSVGVGWLERRSGLPPAIIGEGLTLGTRPFLYALAGAYDLLVIHLHADPFITDLRVASRGAGQAETFVSGTATRAANLAKDLRAKGVNCIDVDSGQPEDLDLALDLCLAHLVIDT